MVEEHCLNFFFFFFSIIFSLLFFVGGEYGKGPPKYIGKQMENQNLEPFFFLKKICIQD